MNPTIQDAKQIAKRCGKTGVVIFFLDDRTGDFGFSSYGIDVERCRQMKSFGDVVFNAALNNENFFNGQATQATTAIMMPRTTECRAVGCHRLTRAKNGYCFQHADMPAHMENVR